MEEYSIMSEEEKTDWGSDLYKKWFKAGGTGGFLSIRPWWDAGKLSVDIGEVNPNGGLKSHTNVWCSMVNLSIYLKAVYDGTANRLFKDESFIYYGGANTEGGPVARILKVTHWKQGDPDSGFAWKTGIFDGKQTSTGAYIAKDMEKPRSMNMIKISRLEMAEMHYRLDLAMDAFATFAGQAEADRMRMDTKEIANPEQRMNAWLEKLNGKRK